MGYLILNEIWKSKISLSGMSIIDIGANIGYFTLLAAGIVGVTGNVYAFEPEPQNYSLLARNVRLNGFTNVRLYQKAVSRCSGKMNLNLGSQSGTHSLFSVKETTSKTIMIDLIGLDEIFIGTNNRIDVIKVDVQGAEMDVLMGMQNIIKGNRHLRLFTEFEPDLAHSGFSLKEYWIRLIESGFKYIYLINEQEQRLELSDFQYSVNFCTEKQVASVNLLCSKDPENI